MAVMLPHTASLRSSPSVLADVVQGVPPVRRTRHQWEGVARLAPSAEGELTRGTIVVARFGLKLFLADGLLN